MKTRMVGWWRMFRSDDPLVRFKFLRIIAKRVLPQYRFKWPQMDWWKDSLFNNYLERFDELNGANADRRWMLHELLRLVTSVPGDTAECGVYKGASSYLICEANKINARFQRTHYMFDSFEGLSVPSGADGRHWKKGDLSSRVDTLQYNLKEFENISIHKGWIPERFRDVEGHTFSFVHIDVDLMEPTLKSMEFFYPRMSRGGIIVCDDYGCTSCPGATTAIDGFLSGKPEEMLSLSGGGGFLIMGCETQSR